MFEHFAAFSAMTFSCRHDACSEKVSYCRHCHATIDSRDYLCKACGAGYRDFGGVNNYFIVPGTICPCCTRCPKCRGPNFQFEKADEEKYLLKCSECGHTMSAPKNPEDISTHTGHKKYKCSCCHEIEFNNDRSGKQLGTIAALLPLYCLKDKLPRQRLYKKIFCKFGRGKAARLEYEIK